LERTIFTYFKDTNGLEGCGDYGFLSNKKKMKEKGDQKEEENSILFSYT
jgi:hypothetical protein